MTTQIKWLVALGLILLTFLAPFLFIVTFVGILIIIFIPGPKQHSAPGIISPLEISSQTVVTQPVDSVAGIIAEIEQEITETTNDDVRNGLARALSIIQAKNIQPAPVQYAAEQYIQPVQLAPVAMTEAEVQQQKEQQDQKNTNTILYVASFLLVAAAVLFIGTGLSPTAKFAGIVVITAAFYLAGLMLYKSYEKLRPAALAFIGTGVALVPFAGLALYNYVLPDQSWAWFITSFIGLVMYVYATMTVRNQILAYLTSAFVFSLTASSVAVLSVPLVWYFVTIIFTGAALGYIAYKKPSWLPAELATPFEQNSMLSVPLAIAGSLFVNDRLSLFDYEIIIGAATLYYLVMSLGLGSHLKLAYWSLGRVGFLALLLMVTYDMTDSWQYVGVALSVTAFVAYAYSRRHLAQEYENLWSLYPQFAIATATCFWLFDWTNVSIGLVLLAVMSLIQLMKYRISVYGIGTVTAFVLLPVTLFEGVFTSLNSAEVIALVTLFTAVCALLVRYGLQNTSSAYQQVATALYVAMMVESVVATVVAVDAGLTAFVFVGNAILLFCASFIEKQDGLLVGSNVMLAIGVYFTLQKLDFAGYYQVLLTAWICAGLWYGLRFYFKGVRQSIMFGSVLAILILAAVVSTYYDSLVIAAGITGCVAATVMLYEGMQQKLVAYLEFSVFLYTASLQVVAGHLNPDLNNLVYTHWWAATVGAMALLRLQEGMREDAKNRGIIALAVLSLPTGLAALSDPDTYQMLFLIEHLAIAVGGYMLNKKIALQWGVVGMILAVIWLLKGYTYILLALMAIALICLAVWRLLRK